jgi:hypothetical protein
MQTSQFRHIGVLIAVLFAGASLYAAFGEPHGAGSPRWPSADALYAVDGWSAGLERPDQGGFVSRTFTSQSGRTATLSIFSNQTPKLYGAGAEVPYLGNGYSVDTPESGAVLPPLSDGVHGLIARRGAEQWLVLYAYGERRGLLGNGPQAWALALFDGILGRDNDYYKLYLATRTVGTEVDDRGDMSQLATTLFGRIADFYSR